MLARGERIAVSNLSYFGRNRRRDQLRSSFIWDRLLLDCRKSVVAFLFTLMSSFSPSDLSQFRLENILDKNLEGAMLVLLSPKWLGRVLTRL